MLHYLRLGEEFFARLVEIDARIAHGVARAGCRHCGGRLHQSNYTRKPRGAKVAAAGEAFTLRHSLCCGQEGCRKRALPPSLRFLGRRVYLEVVVLLASVFAQLAPALRVAGAATGVSKLTLQRWGMWWRSTFPKAGTWVELRARFRPPPPEEELLPKSLVDRVDEELGDGARGDPSLADLCQAVARLLAPVTTQSVSDASRFVRSALVSFAAP